MSRAPDNERLRVAECCRRLAELMGTVEYATMTHEEAYDAIYGGLGFGPEHKTARLENIAHREHARM